MDALLEFIDRHTVDGSITLSDELAAATSMGLSLKEVEEQVLIRGVTPRRLIRNCLSCVQQLRLLRARVTVIGCGGLGGAVAEILARLGVGNLRLVDPDSFDEHNLNRQRFATVETLGVAKVEAAQTALMVINPATQVDTVQAEFTEADVLASDIIIDCLDSAGKRLVLAALCRQHRRPLVHGAVREWFGQVGIATAANNLIGNLYSQTPTESLHPPQVLAPTVFAVASMQAAETCKLLLALPSPLKVNWLSSNLLHCDYELIPSGPCP